jgi:K+-transporting ATPase ATPase C chain
MTDGESGCGGRRIRELRPALLSTLMLALGGGALFPAGVWLIARLVWPRQAEGSLVLARGRTVGSERIGQAFLDPGHFWGRPSATVDGQGRPLPWNAANGGGSNLSPGNPALAAAVAERAARLRADPGPGPLPPELLMASGSGLDPHISPEAAAWQVPRVARARRLDEGRLRRLVADCTERPQFGFLGEARVNVLRLNLALERLGGPRR